MSTFLCECGKSCEMKSGAASTNIRCVCGITPTIYVEIERMHNGEIRYRLKSTDGTGYVRTEMASNGAWQQAHFHAHVTETYFVDSGWIVCAELIDEKLILSRYDAHQWFTIAPTVVHNIYLSPGSVIQTVKHGNALRSEDKNMNAATHKFTATLQNMSEEQVCKTASATPSRLFVQVACDGNGISPVGLLKPERAHATPGYGPHTSVVIVVPFRFADDGEPELLVYRRPESKATSPGTWDAFGGHVEVSAKQDLLSHTDGDGGALFHSLIKATALRELQEELVVGNFTWTSCNLHRYGDYGAFSQGLLDPSASNVEYSTLYVVHLPPNLTESFRCFETSDRSGEILFDLDNRFCMLDTLIEEYEQNPMGFADGLGRILTLHKVPKKKTDFISFLKSVVS